MKLAQCFAVSRGRPVALEQYSAVESVRLIHVLNECLSLLSSQLSHLLVSCGVHVE